MKLAIVGNRGYNNFTFIKNEFFKLYATNFPSYIISGGSKGVDSMAYLLSKELEIPILVFWAKWKKYNVAAGPIRNEIIAKKCDEMLAFWDGVSRGTKNAISLAKKFDKKVYIVNI